MVRTRLIERDRRHALSRKYFAGLVAIRGALKSGKLRSRWHAHRTARRFRFSRAALSARGAARFCRGTASLFGICLRVGAAPHQDERHTNAQLGLAPLHRAPKKTGP